MFEMCTVCCSPAVHVSRCCCSNHAAATWPRKTPGCDFVTEMLGPRAIVDGVPGSQKPLGTPAPRDVGGFWPWWWGFVDGPNQTSSKSTGPLWVPTKPPLSQLAHFGTVCLEEVWTVGLEEVWTPPNLLKVNWPTLGQLA